MARIVAVITVAVIGVLMMGWLPTAQSFNVGRISVRSPIVLRMPSTGPLEAEGRARHAAWETLVRLVLPRDQRATREPAASSFAPIPAGHTASTPAQQSDPILPIPSSLEALPSAVVALPAEVEPSPSAMALLIAEQTLGAPREATETPVAQPGGAPDPDDGSPGPPADKSGGGGPGKGGTENGKGKGGPGGD